MVLSDPLFWLIILTSFIATAVSSTFAIGGGFIMIAVLSSVLPISAIVPIHSILMIGLSISRAWYFRRHILWVIVVPFIVGSAIGVSAGASIYVDLPDAFIAAAIGALMLAAVWFPAINWRPAIPQPFFWIGIIHSFLSTLFTFGGLFQPLMVRTRMEKMQITATLAAGLLGMNLFKITGYTTFGFDYSPYIQLACLSILASLPGARVGRHFVQRVPDHMFRLIFKLIITLFAIRLIYHAWDISGFVM